MLVCEITPNHPGIMALIKFPMLHAEVIPFSGGHKGTGVS